MTPSLELVKTPAENAAAAAGDAAGTAKQHKLWGGRFAGGPAAALEKLNRSLDVDFRLWPFDIEL